MSHKVNEWPKCIVMQLITLTVKGIHTTSRFETDAVKKLDAKLGTSIFENY